MRASIKLVIAASDEMMEMVFGFLEIYSHRSLIFLKKPVHCQHLAIQNSKQQYRQAYFTIDDKRNLICYITITKNSTTKTTPIPQSTNIAIKIYL